MRIRANRASRIRSGNVRRRLRVAAVFGLLLAAVSLQAEDPSKISLADNGRGVMTYNADLIPSPDADAPWFKRSGFIHPVYTPGGRVVTEGFPADHLHQHGLIIFCRTTLKCAY